MKRLYGTIVPIVTPLTGQDTIDEESLERLTDHIADCGAQGVFPCGTTGEMMYLTVAERKRIAETVVKHATGRLRVFVHTGAWNLKDTIELCRHAESIGADGISVVTPAFYKLSDRGLIDFYVTVADSVSGTFPIYLYAIPQNAGNDLNVSVCEEIARRCPNVIGIKYSFPDFTRMQNLLAVNGGKFSVLAGPDHLFAAFCAIGGDGVVSGCANVIGKHYTAIWEAIQRKDYELAAAYQRRTNMLGSVLGSINSIAAFKTVLKEEGIIRTNAVRRPMENLTPEQEKKLLSELEKLDYKNVAA